MVFVLSGLLALGLVGLFGAHEPSPAELEPARPEARPYWTVLAAFAVLASFFASCVAATLAGHGQTPLPAWLAALPLEVIDDRAPRFGHAPYGDVALTCAALQAIALATLYGVLRERRAGITTRVILGLTFAAMSTIALNAPVIASFDLYAYAGAAHAGFGAAYQPIAQSFSGDWSALNSIYGARIPPSPYGPVWLVLSAIPAHAPSLAATLQGLRALEFLALLVCVGALIAQRIRVESVALIALNPALFTLYVVDGHNDLVPVALVLAAQTLRPRSRILCAIVAALAAATKLPFMLIAPLAFAQAATRRERMAGALAVVVLGTAFSAFGGTAYLHALQQTAAIYRGTLADPIANLLRAAVVLVAVAGVVTIVWNRRVSPTCAWLFVALGTSLFGWYWAWGIPFASIERRWLPAFLVTLPVVTALVATVYQPSLARWDTIVLASVITAPLAWFALRSPRQLHRGAATA